MTTMIHQFYPSAARKELEAKAKITPALPAPAAPFAGGTGEAYTLKAIKMGITVSEYLRRRGIVQREANACKFQHGDTVYPVMAKDFKKYGKCLVVGVVRDIDDYGEVEWHEPPFILSVRPMGTANVINCTANWVQRTEPEIVNEC